MLENILILDLVVASIKSMSETGCAEKKIIIKYFLQKKLFLNIEHKT